MTMQNYTPISMPSLGKIFDMMKNLPPQQAAQDINSPDPAKKLAAMMVANSDKQLQQQQAAQQQPMPTVAQKLSQGMTQAPTAPTPPMPAVPPQAQAKPGAQGIAALQPQQMPPGSAMGILPTQVAPQTQGAPEPVQKHPAVLHRLQAVDRLSKANNKYNVLSNWLSSCKLSIKIALLPFLSKLSKRE